ncbi:MAG: ATP-binding protein [Anaerolineae bacterium]|nr:ATP-binding protein [Anaerolineae bacterium]
MTRSTYKEMQVPTLIVVAGPPASGKTTLARQLALALRMPLICKDTLKESLFDHLAAADRAWSQRLGRAVIQCMYALAEEILGSGASLILESTFVHPRTPGELDRLAESTGARLFVVYCYAAPEVLSRRFNERSRTTRHPGHHDRPTTTAAELIARGWLERPDYPGTVLPVDTTHWDALDVPALVRQLGG